MSTFSKILIFAVLLQAQIHVVLSASESVDTKVRSEESAPTLTELYRGFIDGNGGHANILSLNTLVISARVIHADGDAVDFKVYRKRPAMMRMRLNMPQYYTETVFNGKEGWRQVTSKVTGDSKREELSEAELDNIRPSSSIEGPFFKLGSDSSNITSITSDVIGETPAFRLQVDPSAETVYGTIWLDAETFQEIKLMREVKIEGQEETVVEEVLLSEQDKIDGVYFARRMDYYHDGELVKTLEVDRIRANIGIFDSYFSLD